MRSERLQREIDRSIEQGWQIDSETPQRVVLIKRYYGSLVLHLVIAIFTAWWTFGLANLAYGAWAYLSQSERKVLREPVQPCPECGANASPEASYCAACGTDLRETRRLVCPECGEDVEPDDRYCRECGSELA